MTLTKPVSGAHERARFGMLAEHNGSECQQELRKSGSKEPEGFPSKKIGQTRHRDANMLRLSDANIGLLVRVITFLASKLCPQLCH